MENTEQPKPRSILQDMADTISVLLDDLDKTLTTYKDRFEPLKKNNPVEQTLIQQEPSPYYSSHAQRLQRIADRISYINGQFMEVLNDLEL